MEFADPKSDIAFKKVFGNENKKEILISFLNAILELKDKKMIEGVEILTPYQAPKIEGLKETTLDVKVKDKRGVTFIVEMQVEKQDYFSKRALYYTSKAYVEQIEKAQDYPKLNQVIFIGILNFKMFEGSQYLSRHLILNTKTHKQEIKDFEFNFIELKKFKKGVDEIGNIVDKWIYFLKNAGELKVVPKELTKTVEIAEAFDVLDRHKWTKQEIEVYDYWDMKEGGHLDALETAKKDGKLEGKLEGRLEGRLEGQLEGEIKGVCNSIHSVLSAKSLYISKEDILKINTIQDLQQLEFILQKAIIFTDIKQLHEFLEKI